MEDLKSCPFCGSNAELIDCDNGYFCFCRECRGQSNNYPTWKEAEEKWNTRPSQWISVKEKVPDDADNYIVYTKYGCIELSHFLPSLKCFAEDYVTHYMTLPTPPTNL